MISDRYSEYFKNWSFRSINWYILGIIKVVAILQFKHFVTCVDSCVYYHANCVLSCISDKNTRERKFVSCKLLYYRDQSETINCVETKRINFYIYIIFITITIKYIIKFYGELNLISFNCSLFYTHFINYDVLAFILYFVYLLVRPIFCWIVNNYTTFSVMLLLSFLLNFYYF